MKYEQLLGYIKGYIQLGMSPGTDVVVDGVADVATIVIDFFNTRVIIDIAPVLLSIVWVMWQPLSSSFNYLVTFFLK